MKWWPPRFRNYEDAMLYMECRRTHKPFPAEKWIYPFVQVGNMCVENPEYKDAHYEESIIYDDRFQKTI